MMGTLAIMGILAIAGIWMYNSAMDRLKANTIINEAQKRAVVVAGQIGFQGRTDPSLGEFSENEFAGGTFSTNVITDGLYQQFGIQVSGVPKAICQNILNSIGESTSIRWLGTVADPRTPLTSCDQDNTLVLIYNNDMSSVESDTRYCQDDGGCQTVCGTCNISTHLCENECTEPTGTCTSDSQCRQAGICAGCNQQTNTCQACQRVAYLEGTGTQYINTDHILSDDFSWEIKFNGLKTAETLLGAKEGEVRTGLVYFCQTGKITLNIGDRNCVNTPFILGNLSSGTHSVKLQVANSTANIWVDGTNLYTDRTFSGNYTPNLPIALFADNTGQGVIEKTNSSKVYYMRIWDNGQLVRDFVPVLDANGVPALFDKAHDQLYYNAGTGTFSYGS